ncbi:MAG: hypothetical protein CVV23_02105 [Ignavibacteriae bacterium HGW-Ignavibacteriae-2]|jgi:hypothetical protein|nr:hypothetical protein [Bacteroidota bacterium]PKL90161.1 MAG: hypothetical protein CVV23_02105 [Ignavibacteriae bacterium HGW-Ignavibacteriae-2]
MSAKSEPWYIHAILYVIIFALAYVLIRVAIIDPTEVIEKETYIKTESRLRMSNLREAQILWQKRFGTFTDNLDTLIGFIKNDTGVAKLLTGFDSTRMKSTNPFKNLSTGSFVADSLFYYPGNHLRFVMRVDTSTAVDTIINRRGTIVKIDSSKTMGSRYLIETPDSLNRDKIGDLFSDALKNTASWE